MRLLTRMKDTGLLEQYTLERNSSGTGKDQVDPTGERGGHHDKDLEKATDDPRDAGSMGLTRQKVRDLPQLVNDPMLT